MIKNKALGMWSTKGIEIMFLYKNKHNKFNLYGNIKNLYNAFRLSSKEKNFVRNLFASYVLIIIISIYAMGILSYNFELQRITELTIKSNNELLYQYKNTIDDLILGNIDKLSLSILQSIISDPVISYYFTNPYEDNYTDIPSVMNYLNKQKSTNSAISSIELYYTQNDLLISTQGITFSNGESIAKSHIKEIIDSSYNSAWKVSKEPDKLNPDNGDKGYVYFVRRIAYLSFLTGAAGGISISIDEDIFRNTIIDSAPVDFGDIFIIDEKGQIISHNQKDFLFTNVSETMSFGKELTDQTNMDGYFLTDLNGVKTVVSFTASKVNNWRYITVKPIAKFNEGIKILGDLIQVIGLSTFLFALFASILSTKYFYNLLRKLGDLCRNIMNVNSLNKPKGEYALIGSTLGAISVKLKEHEEQIEQNMPIIKHHFINSLLYRRFENKEEIDEKMKFLNISFPFDSFMVISISFKKAQQMLGYEAYEYIKIQVVDEVEKVLSDKNKNCICTDINSNITVIINFNREENDMQECIKDFLRYLTKSMCLEFYIGVSSFCGNITDVHNMFIESESCLNYSYLHPDMYIFTMDEVREWDDRKPEYGKKLLVNLCNSLKEQDKNSTLDYINSLFSEISKEQYSYNYSMKLLTKFFIYAESMFDVFRIDKNEVIDGDFITCFNKTNNIIELRKCFTDTVNCIFEILESRKSDKVSALVAEVKEYITENVMRYDLSLNSVADAKCITSTYLSRIFKDETGINFVDYLIEAKLSEAEKLVAGSDLKIEEIASMIGYSSSQYFIKKFKTQYGCTPKAYRVMLLRKKNFIPIHKTSK
jgi:AraC-like DNA-binding protein